MNSSELAARIQHTNVRPDATRADIDRLLAECVEYGFDGAMIAPIWVPHASTRREGTAIKVCTAFDYPMGGGTTSAVVAQAREVFLSGADEVDVMTKVGWLRSGMLDEYRGHLAAVVDAADGRVVKAMLEAALLTEEELKTAVELSIEAGISYVKNSSGYGGGNAEPELIQKLAEHAAGRVGIKASGGIRTREGAEALIAAGADLLGASGSVAIMSSGQPDVDY